MNRSTAPSLSLSSKLPQAENSIFSIMSRLAEKHGAVNLSQGFPGFPVSDELIDRVYHHMRSGKNQYAPMPGLPLLRERIALMTQDSWGYLPCGDREVTITSGATEALFATIQALVGEGDEVILFDPAYDSYVPAIRLAGGIPVHSKLKLPDFSVDWDEVEGLMSERTKLVIINSPHNPTGALFGPEDMLALERLADRYPFFLLSDEAYAYITYDERRHHSILESPVLRDRGIAVFSFGKTFHATGWKVGYTIAPGFITEEIRKVHQCLTFSVSTPVQYAIADYLVDPAHYRELGLFYEKKRDAFLQAIEGSVFRPVKTYGTYFQLLSYRDWSGAGDFEDDVAVAHHLTVAHGIASIPISVFYEDRQDDALLRFCFAKEENTLTQAGEILCKI